MRHRESTSGGFEQPDGGAVLGGVERSAVLPGARDDAHACADGSCRIAPHSGAKGAP
jgi:hypothetical protein